MSIKKSSVQRFFAVLLLIGLVEFGPNMTHMHSWSWAWAFLLGLMCSLFVTCSAKYVSYVVLESAEKVAADLKKKERV